MAKKSSTASKLTLAPSTEPLKLDLGGGQTPREGFASVDLNAKNAAHRVDLFKFPWPFETSSVEELHASHFIEHIPLRDVEEKDMAKSATSFERANIVGKDMLFAFFDECHRILKPGAMLTCIWPALRSNRAFQDPTHRRFIPMETMFYLSKAWREGNKLDHYRVTCDFQGDCNFSMTNEEATFTPEVQQRRFNQYWNTIIDFHAVMKAVK